MFVTYADLFSFCMVVLTLISITLTLIDIILTHTHKGN